MKSQANNISSKPTENTLLIQGKLFSLLIPLAALPKPAEISGRQSALARQRGVGVGFQCVPARQTMQTWLPDTQAHVPTHNTEKGERRLRGSKKANESVCEWVFT